MLIIDKKGYEYRKWNDCRSFPVGTATCDIMLYCNNTFECHWHDGVELLYVTEGELDHRVNGTRYLMKKGDFMFVNAGAMHEGYATELQCGKYMVLSFLTSALCGGDNDSLNEKYFGGIMDEKSFPVLFLEAGDSRAQEIIRLCEEIAILHKKRPICYELEIKSLLLKIWAILFTCASESAGAQKPDFKIDRIKSAVSYINDNYQNKLSLEEIALSCNLSKSEFCRYFKRMMHRTPFDYVTDLRVRKSTELLDKGTSVTEAAMSSGFFDSSYYTKTFKRYMGCTPREYVKKAH